MSTPVVIGVGNPYRRDDGVGPAVVELLRQRARSTPALAGVAMAECDGEPGRLLELWEGARLAIVVDAVRTPAPHPGRLHRRSLHEPGESGAGAECSRPPRSGRPERPAASSHAIDLGEAVALAQVLDRLPAQLLLYAVEVADTSFGLGLSTPVAATAALLADEITAQLCRC
jgi:hydrogenase maturation protease